MVCHSAERTNEFIMKYMDGTLDEAEAARLGEHLSECAACEAEFRMYDGILSGFSEMELTPAPDGFEECVMRKVMELPSLAAKLNTNIENMLCLIWGTVSVLFGVGFIAVLNREAIMDYLYARPELEAYAGALSFIGEYSAALAANLTLTVGRLLTSAAEYAISSRYVIVAALAVLAAIQFFVSRRRPADAATDDD